MNKDDLHITINVKTPEVQFPDVTKQVAAASEAVNKFGMSAAAAAAALGSAGPCFAQIWDEVLLREIEQYQETEFLAAFQGFPSGEVVGLWQEIERAERKAQRRALLVLLLAFILLTMLVGLL